jgi:RNA polymerase sigma-70 factor (ECF subfamily)
MESRTAEATWERLATLLTPIHESALATARRLCRSRGDGDDLYQESVVRAFEKLHTLRDESKFRSWFYATLLSRHRSRSRRPFWKRLIPLERAFAGEREPSGEDGGQWEERIMRANRAADALATLDAAQREVIVLFEVDGYSIAEIAEMQRASIAAVKSRLVRGREKLRRWYARRGFGGTAAPGANGAAAATNVDAHDDRVRPGRAARLAVTPALEPAKELSHE